MLASHIEIIDASIAALLQSRVYIQTTTVLQSRWNYCSFYNEYTSSGYVSAYKQIT